MRGVRQFLRRCVVPSWCRLVKSASHAVFSWLLSAIIILFYRLVILLFQIMPRGGLRVILRGRFSGRGGRRVILRVHFSGRGGFRLSCEVVLAAVEVSGPSCEFILAAVEVSGPSCYSDGAKVKGGRHPLAVAFGAVLLCSIRCRCRG